jgi:hypothetical protein
MVATDAVDRARESGGMNKNMAWRRARMLSMAWLGFARTAEPRRRMKKHIFSVRAIAACTLARTHCHQRSISRMLYGVTSRARSGFV